MATTSASVVTPGPRSRTSLKLVPSTRPAGGGRGAGDAGLDDAERAEPRVERSDAHEDRERGTEQPGDRGERAQQSAAAVAEHDGEVDRVGAGQGRGDAEQLGEALRREEPALLDQHVAREGGDAAEAEHADLEERGEQRPERRRLGWRLLGRVRKRRWPAGQSMPNDLSLRCSASAPCR